MICVMQVHVLVVSILQYCAIFCASTTVSVNTSLTEVWKTEDYFFSCEVAGSLKSLFRAKDGCLLSQWEWGEDTQKYLDRFLLCFLSWVNLWGLPLYLMFSIENKGREEEGGPLIYAVWEHTKTRIKAKRAIAECLIVVLQLWYVFMSLFSLRVSLRLNH